MSGIDETAWNAVQSLARRFADRVDASRIDIEVSQGALRQVHVWLEPYPDLAAAEALLALYAARNVRTYQREETRWVTGVVDWEDTDVTVLIFLADAA